MAALLTVAHHTLYYSLFVFYLYVRHDLFIRDIRHSGHITHSRIEIEEMMCVAVCCSVLQCVAVCCSVLKCVAVK